jgi:hypothetical protein
MERTAISLLAAATVGLIVWPAAVAILGDAGSPDAAGFAHPGVWIAAVAGLIGGGLLRRQLPRRLDGAARRRPALTAIWVILAGVTVVQTGRFGAHLIDPSRDWWITTKQEFWSKHACMTAYLYAADLDRQGEENVYDAAHYPGLTRDADVHPTVQHLTPEDPYQYPPQFLLLPRLALEISNDFLAIRPVWYAVQALGFLAVAALFVRWWGGGAGARALWLLPLLWISVPSALNFQYGQFHVSTIALAVAAFLAFERRRDAAGGSLLAASIVAKGFPAIVLVPLALQRRWRALAWTGAWALGWTAAAWAVLGPEPFRAFFGHHVANLQSGASFAFEEAWPELRVALLAGNLSPFAMIRKLGDLGVPGATDDLARLVHGAFAVACLGLSILAARARSPRARVIAALSLVNLAAMTSPAAWGDYVPLGTLWLVGMLAGRLNPAVVAIAGGFCFLLPGVVPIGNFPGPVASMTLSIAGTVLLVALNGWTVLREAGMRVLARSRPVRELATETG